MHINLLIYRSDSICSLFRQTKSQNHNFNIVSMIFLRRRLQTQLIKKNKATERRYIESRFFCTEL